MSLCDFILLSLQQREKRSSVGGADTSGGGGGFVMSSLIEMAFSQMPLLYAKHGYAAVRAQFLFFYSFQIYVGFIPTAVTMCYFLFLNQNSHLEKTSLFEKQNTTIVWYFLFTCGPLFDSLFLETRSTEKSISRYRDMLRAVESRFSQDIRKVRLGS